MPVTGESVVKTSMPSPQLLLRPPPPPLDLPQPGPHLLTCTSSPQPHRGLPGAAPPPSPGYADHPAGQVPQGFLVHQQPHLPSSMAPQDGRHDAQAPALSRGRTPRRARCRHVKALPGSARGPCGRASVDWWPSAAWCCGRVLRPGDGHPEAGLHAHPQGHQTGSDALSLPLAPGGSSSPWFMPTPLFRGEARLP